MSPSPMSPSSRTSGGGRGGGVTELESGDDLGYMEYINAITHIIL